MAEKDEEQAALDEALAREAEHEKERAAAHKQGLIEKGTRDHHLDDG